MAKFMVVANYTADGLKGLLKEGGTSRRSMIADMAKSAGGSLEAFYFAFGRDDVYAILDLPDNVTAAALALAVSASGLTKCKVIVLLSAEDIDASAKAKVLYRPPGA